MLGSTQSSEIDRLIEKFTPFARAVAAKEAAELNLPISIEDAIGAAQLGLVEAASRFNFEQHDPTRGDIDTNFKSFAYLRIRGSVIDEARRNSIVKRRGHEKGVRVQMLSLDEYGVNNYGDEYNEPLIQLEAISADADMVIDFESALDVLTPRERKVVMGLAVGARGRELAAELGVTESRVSQISSEARNKLLERMTA